MRRLGPYVALALAAFGMAVALFGCPGPGPTPTPTPSPTPTIEPTPTPTPVGCLPPAGETGWTEWDTLAPEHIAVVIATRDEIGNVCGQEPEASLELMGTALRAKGLCSGRKDDAVFIRRSDDSHLWEEYHSVAYATGCWTIAERQYRGVWRHE